MRQSPLLTALLIVIVLLLATTLSRAETVATPHPDPAAAAQTEAFLAGLAQRVALTPAELAAVRPILEDNLSRKAQAWRTQAANADTPQGREALKAAFQSINRQTRARLSAVLPLGKLVALGNYLKETREQAQARQITTRQGS